MIRFIPIPAPGSFQESLSVEVTERLFELIRDDVVRDYEFEAELTLQLRVMDDLLGEDYSAAQIAALMISTVLERLIYFDEDLWRDLHPQDEDDDLEEEPPTPETLAVCRRSVERGVWILHTLWQRLQKVADTDDAMAFVAEVAPLFEGEPGLTPIEGLFWWICGGPPRTTISLLPEDLQSPQWLIE